MKSLTRRTTALRTGTRRRLFATGALLCIGVLPLSACSLFNPPLERDESVHAIFDAEQDIVKMPLDDYLYYERDTHYEYTAHQIAMKQCYAEHGQSYTDPDQAPQSESAPRGEMGRKYGPWNVEYAKNATTKRAKPLTPRYPRANGQRSQRKKRSPRTFASPIKPTVPPTTANCARSLMKSGSSAYQIEVSPRVRQAPSPRKPR